MIYPNILDNNSKLALIVFKNGRFLLANNNFFKCTNYKKNIVGKKDSEIIIYNKENICNLPIELQVLDSKGNLRPSLGWCEKVILNQEEFNIWFLYLLSQESEKLLINDIFTQYETLFQNTGTAIIIINEHKKIVKANKVFCYLAGYNCEEIENKKEWTEFVPSPDLERMLEYHYLRRKDPSIAPNNYECMFKDRWGKLHYLHLTVAMLPGTKLSIASMIDISKQKQILNELQDKQRMITTLMSNIPGMVYRSTLNQNRRMIFVSEGCYQITGYHPEDFLSLRPIFYDELIFSEDKPKVIKSIKNALNKKENFQITYRIKTANGELKWVWEKGVGVFSEDQQLTFLEGVIVDITEQKLIENTLVKSQEELIHQKQELEKKNIALNEVLLHIEKEKQRLVEEININIEKISMPIIAKLEKTSSFKTKQYINILKKQLKELTNKYGRVITSPEWNLSNREVEICTLIVNGLSSKEISQLLNISVKSVETHRKNIRRKLGLQHKKINLSTYLRSSKMGS